MNVSPCMMITTHKFHPNQYPYFQRLFKETAGKHPEWLKPMGDNLALVRTLPSGKTWKLEQITNTISDFTRLVNKLVMPESDVKQREATSFHKKPIYELNIGDHNSYISKTMSHDMQSDVYMRGYTQDYIDVNPIKFQKKRKRETIQTPDSHEITTLQIFPHTPRSGEHIDRIQSIEYARDGNTLGSPIERRLSIIKTMWLPNNEIRAVDKTYTIKLHPETGKPESYDRFKTIWIQDADGNLNYEMD